MRKMYTHTHIKLHRKSIKGFKVAVGSMARQLLGMNTTSLS